MSTLFKEQIQRAEDEITRIHNTGKRMKSGELTWKDMRRINKLRRDIAKAQAWLDNSQPK